MNRISLLVIVAALILTGCVTVKTIDLSAPVDESTSRKQAFTTHEEQAHHLFAEVNRLGKKKTAILRLADGRSIMARHLQVTRDSTSWFNVTDDAFASVATSEIRGIRFRSTGKGAQQGLGLGFLVGSVTGAILGYQAGAEDECKPNPNCEGFFCNACFDVVPPAGQTMVISAALFGFAAGIVGAVIGASVGGQDTYRIHAPAPTTPVIVEEVKQQILRRP